MIIRASKREKYTIVSNAPINDKGLSWEARGMLVWLLSKPNNWSINGESIAHEGKAGVDKVWRMLKEIENAGYLRRERVRDEQGRYRWESILREEPYLDFPSMVNPPLVNPTLDSPSLVNAGSILKTDPIKTDLINTDQINIGFAHFWNLYPRKLDKQAAFKAWHKLKPSTDLADKILKRLLTFIQVDWAITESQFIPYPASWLNGARWEDEIPTFGPSKANQPDFGTGGMANLAKHLGLTNGSRRNGEAINPHQGQLVSATNGRSDHRDVAGDFGRRPPVGGRVVGGDSHDT